ncbi:hypothetical protein [Bacillus sp. WP8]|uniref:preprotein translocase subunit SecA n=1 Tax=Bacillus sp. WP8 TaxID=756828 RepID=UPI0037C0DAA7
MVEEGEVVMVDWLTGRLMKGGGYSEGVDEGMEGKEGVEVEKERMRVGRIRLEK